MRSIRVGAALAVGGTLLLVTACGGGGTGAKAAGAGTPSAGATATGGGGGGGGASTTPGAPATSAAPTSGAVVDIEPKDGTQNAAPDALKVAVSSGKLSQVTVTDKSGQAVQGSISADGTSWVPAAGLSVADSYQVKAQATDANGVATTATSSFSTLTPSKTSRSQDNVATGSTYGVGMIVSFNFGMPIQNKKAVEQGITFVASDGTTVKGHWMGNNRLDIRPQNFWNPNTQVKIQIRLKNVEVSPGVYGGSDRDESFTISSRAQVSTVDAAAHTMTVQDNGQTVETVPISSGSDEHPTYNGTMVIEAKEGTAHMTSASVPGLKPGEYDLMVPHSMRLTDSGTYVHGNNWSSAGTFGTANVSHGCVGLQDAPGDAGGTDTPAAKFYAASMVGDVVKVVNSKGAQVTPDNGLSGWNMPWSTW
ncbi:Ig-like domain-containing protein [Kitasatospora sp. NBC_01287]|uniref:L,D-transpeptidase n=1 Tax=Kitasatospora sp. NBC_01287 TaxID=2903573 RepID=UPI00224D4250|nr:Ig-like domain-containing protein [Kitasatospora sp. NBC_01287]MCX4746673.1 Ig-like domain-containing protein [Kitasatospora sp. NBC_01287]